MIECAPAKRIKLLLEHYERFDPGTKAQLPLKRLYVPDPPGDSGTGPGA